MDYYKQVFKRKSFHLFRDTGMITDQDIRELEEFIGTVKPLYVEIKTEVRIVPENETTCKRGGQFVAEVRKQAKVYPNRQAIVQAVDVCIKKDILKEFLLENKKEVIDMVFFEYDAEAEKRVIYKDGRADGKEEGKAEEIVRLCKKFHVSKEDTIRELETELSVSTQAAMDYYDNFSKELEKKSLNDQKAL